VSVPDGTRKLLLIRHGRSDFSSTSFRRSPRGPQWDPPLGAEGRQQAELLAARLRLMDPPTGLYCSPLQRCRETIAPYARSAELEVVLEEGVAEVFGGEWEGKSFEEIVSTDEELARRFRDQDAMFSSAPGGEPGDQLRARVTAAIDAILARHGSGNVVVVTHGGVINAYVGTVLGVDRDMFFLPDNTSVNTVLVDGDRSRVWFLNDVRHLTEPAMFVPPAGSDDGGIDDRGRVRGT
jgi:broad specificity phosphatase PhoE